MRKKPKNFLIKYFQLLKAVIIILMLVFSLQLVPAMAESRNFASVSIDGKQLFRVSDTNPEKAKERANYINGILKDAVKSQKVPEIEIKKFDDYAKIIVNDRPITVTINDVLSAENANQQAENWATSIRERVNQAIEERSENFIRNTLILSSVLIKATLFLTRTALWVGVALYITNLFPLTRKWSFDIAGIMRDSLTSPIFKGISVTNILVLIGLFLGLIILSGAVTNVLRSRILRVLRISRGAQEVIAIIFKYTMIGVGSVILLQIVGVDLSSLAILASALGVGIGFGFQDIAKNFGSGLILLFERPIQVGDFIEVGNYMGSVESIGARSVTIRTLDRVAIIVPNSRFLEDEVINWSHHNPVSRIHVPVGVSYSADVKEVKKALLEAGKNHPEVLSVPQHQVFFSGFGDSSLDFKLFVWISKPAHQVSIKSDLCFRIEASLKEHKIEIPFPQRDLHLRTGELPLKLSPEIEQALLRQQQNGRNGI